VGLMDNIKKVLLPKAAEQEKVSETRPEENSFLSLILANQENAESERGDIETTWDDEYKIFQGYQWDTTLTPGRAKVKASKYNSQDNFVFSAVINQHAAITASTPEVIMEGNGPEDKETADKLTLMSQFNDVRNKFTFTWKRMVMQYLKHGPIIGAVLWDPEWMGGSGPDRWVGDVRIVYVRKDEIYFDPAITDLERNLQDCEFIHRKLRKKVAYIKDRWQKIVPEDDNEEQGEGSDPKSVWLYEVWTKGKPRPELITAEWKSYFTQKAADAPDEFKAKEYTDMAEGILDGVHLAYATETNMLEYIPYVYEDGLYPFVFRVLYEDENNPLGMGEIRNIMMPQVLHNLADEIELGAMSVEGLGGATYSKGAVTKGQLDNILANNSKGGMWFEVTDVNQIRDRTGPKVPAVISQYKEQKQRMIETISQNTPIQQGISPGSNVPYSTIAELGARSDTRTKGKIEVLEDFLVELNKLRLSRFAQFYNDQRFYRVKGADGEVQAGTFSNQDIRRQWQREGLDETGQPVPKVETYIPEFDISVKIMDEKPTDRNYYTTTGTEMYKSGAMDIESLWYTLEEGKFPPAQTVLERLAAKDIGLQISQAMQTLPPDVQQMLIQSLAEMMAQAQGGLANDPAVTGQGL
jgi:hypothetical protein